MAPIKQSTAIGVIVAPFGGNPSSGGVPITPPGKTSTPRSHTSADMETDAVSPDKVFNSAGRRCRKELVEQFNAAKNPLAPPFERPFTADEMLNKSSPAPYEEDDSDLGSDLGLNAMYDENVKDPLVGGNMIM